MMKVKDCLEVEVDCYFGVVCYIEVFDCQLQENKFQFVLPKPYWSQALEACHDNMGHLGIERTTSLLRDRFYWPSMIEDIEHHVKSCPRCFKIQNPT